MALARRRAARTLFGFSLLALVGGLLGLAAVAHQHRVRTFGTVSALPPTTLAARPASIVGVNVALEQYADPGQVLEQLDGFAWLRQTFPWEAIEPRPSEFSWTAWDRVVAAGDRYDKEFIAVLNTAPEWARAPGSTDTGPPASVEDFARFAGQFAARYGATIDVYQVWDEPNLLAAWGGQPPSAASYAAVLQAAYTAIHAADPTATVLAAALAPTLEAGPENISDLVYLQQLYDLGAAPFFDAAAGKPYGFYTGPGDRVADPAALNFSRFTLLRQVMVRNGDANKLLWAGNFGWNVHASPWGQATPEQQVTYTLAAFQRAQQEWPWAGVLALESLQPPLPADDPHWGFALLDSAGQPGPLLAAINDQYAGPPRAWPGNYPAQHPAAHYTGPWEFSHLGADIPEDYSAARVTFTFEGSDLGLIVRRGDYRGYLYVEVDGQPANRLPRDERGAYLVLTAPELLPQVTTVPVASGLDPGQPHTAVIIPERGWDQWALAGFAVAHRPSTAAVGVTLALLGSLAALGAAGAWYYGRHVPWGEVGSRLRQRWARLGGTGQILVTAAASGLLYLTSWLTWGNELVVVSRRFGDALPIAVTALTAGLFYFSPSLLMALAALAALFVLFYLRLDLALAFTALFVPFYLQYRLLWQRGFSMVEVCTLLALAAWLLHRVRPTLAGLAYPLRARAPLWQRLSSLDWAVLVYWLVATLSLLAADLNGVALREYRLVMLEPVIFYLLLRVVPLDRPALWRVADFFVLGAVAVASVGLFEYATGSDPIMAEGGIVRIRSVYGSPNNLALYLGRALPLVAAVVVFSPGSRRRWLYAAASLVLAVATVLTFSKGALLLGVPAGLAVVAIAWLGRRGWLLVGGMAAVGLAALPILSRLPRFAGLFDLTTGTSFFRLKLWVSAWRMFLEHPVLGVGPDNFLYHYRSRYILPEAWAEPNLSHPHNLVLDFLTRLGLLGFAAGVWLLVGFGSAAFRAYGQLRRGLAAAGPADAPEWRGLLALVVGSLGLVADMLAHGLVDHGLFLVDLSYAFFLAAAIVQRVPHLIPPPARLAAEPAPAAIAVSGD